METALAAPGAQRRACAVDPGVATGLPVVEAHALRRPAPPALRLLVEDDVVEVLAHVRVLRHERRELHLVGGREILVPHAERLGAPVVPLAVARPRLVRGLLVAPARGLELEASVAVKMPDARPETDVLPELPPLLFPVFLPGAHRDVVARGVDLPVVREEVGFAPRLVLPRGELHRALHVLLLAVGRADAAFEERAVAPLGEGEMRAEVLDRAELGEVRRQRADRGALHARRREVVHAEAVRGVHGVDLVRRGVDEVATAGGDAEVLKFRHGVGLEVDHGKMTRWHLWARLFLVEIHHHHEAAVVCDAFLHEVGGLLNLREETGLEHPSGHSAVGIHEVNEQRARLGREPRRGREARAGQRGERAAVDF